MKERERERKQSREHRTEETHEGTKGSNPFEKAFQAFLRHRCPIDSSDGTTGTHVVGEGVSRRCSVGSADVVSSATTLASLRSVAWSQGSVPK